MIVVVVAFVLSQHPVPLAAHGRHIKAVHGSEVGGVKARTEHSALDSFLRRFGGTVNGGIRLHGKILRVYLDVTKIT